MLYGIIKLIFVHILLDGRYTVRVKDKSLFRRVIWFYLCDQIKKRRNIFYLFILTQRYCTLFALKCLDL